MFGGPYTAPAGAMMQGGKLTMPGGSTRGSNMVRKTTPPATQPNQSGLWQKPVSAPGTQPATGFSGTTFNQPGIGSYTTGITAGQLPQQSIDNAVQRLNPSQSVAPTSYGTPVNRQQQGELNTMLQDQMRAQSWEQKGELNRDAAFQQAQMQLAYDRARGNAALGGYQNIYNQYSNQVNNQQAQQSMLLNLLNSLGALAF